MEAALFMEVTDVHMAFEARVAGLPHKLGEKRDQSGEYEVPVL